MKHPHTILLIDAMEAKYSEKHGWKFSYEYPGFFQYQKGDRSFCFTPDHDELNSIAIQVFDGNGAICLGGADVPCGDSDLLSADQMFLLIEPHLLKY